MDVLQLNELSYKELQAYAKQYSIPANQKKEVLIAEIMAGTENNENAPIQMNKIVVPVTPSAKPSRVTRSTVKKGLVMQEETDVDSLTVQVLSLNVAPVVVEKEASPVKEVAITAPIDTIIESPLAVEEPIVTDASFPTPCEVAEDVSAVEETDDVEYPTPTKLFENNEPFEYNAQGQKIAINRHVYFTSPDAKGNLTELAADQGQKHLHFASPELQMGKGVHWRYEDYNTASEEVVKEEEPVEQDEQSVVSESSEVNSQPARMKLPAGHSDRVMSFWLTKAFANPINNFFK